MSDATLQTLKQHVAKVSMRANVANDIVDFLRLAEPSINRRLRVSSMEKSANIGILENSGILPDDFLELLAFSTNGITYSLEEISKLPFAIFISTKDRAERRAYGGDTTKLYYATFGGRIYFEHRFDNVTEAEIFYYAKPSLLREDGDTNDTLNEEYDVYFNAVMQKVFERLRNAEEVTKYKNEYIEAYSTANAQANIEQLDPLGGEEQGTFIRPRT